MGDRNEGSGDSVRRESNFFLWDLFFRIRIRVRIAFIATRNSIVVFVQRGRKRSMEAV